MTSPRRRWLFALVAMAGASVFAVRSLASHAAKDRPRPPAISEKEPTEEPLTVAAEPERPSESPIAAPEPRPARDDRAESDLQAPIVKAVRARYASELERRDAMVRELENSGPSRESWTGDARGTFEQWRAASASDGKTIRVDGTRCFRAGCAVEATFPDEASFRAADAHTSSLDLGWKGAWMQTPAERTPSGEVRVTWMLLRPDAR